MITDKLPMVKGLILDMDGVLWHDKEPIGNLPAVFETIRSLGLKFVFATNNSGRTETEYQQKLAGMGVFVEPEQIVTSAVGTFVYIQDHFPDKKTLYIIGTPSFKLDGKARGFTVLNDNDETSPADFVIVGMDTELTYKKIDFASRKIRSGAAFLATNTDATYPTPNGLTPGAGSMVSAVSTASGQEPFVIGKPEAYLYRLATKRMGLTASQILCVGDRLNTDILGAHNGGFLSAFVLSGVNSLEDLKNWEPKPTLIADNLSALIND